YSWRGGRKQRLNALTAYAGAALAALSNQRYVDELGKILSHVTVKLTDKTTSPSVQQLGWLETNFARWLKSRIGDIPRLGAFLLEPFQYAKRLKPFNNDIPALLDEHQRMAKG